MRSIEASADIPSELIHAVNDGDVIFLCGAGVSRGVGLPSFQKLTDDVYTLLAIEVTVHLILVWRMADGAEELNALNSHLANGRPGGRN
jgi:hypothetical protein